MKTGIPRPHLAWSVPGCPALYLHLWLCALYPPWPGPRTLWTSTPSSWLFGPCHAMSPPWAPMVPCICLCISETHAWPRTNRSAAFLAPGLGFPFWCPGAKLGDSQTHSNCTIPTPPKWGPPDLLGSSSGRDPNPSPFAVAFWAFFILTSGACPRCSHVALAPSQGAFCDQPLFNCELKG